MVKQIGFSGNYCSKKPVLQMLLCKFEVKGLQTSFWLNALTVAAMVSFPGQLILGRKNEKEKEGKKIVLKLLTHKETLSSASRGLLGLLLCGP